MTKVKHLEFVKNLEADKWSGEANLVLDGVGYLIKFDPRIQWDAKHIRVVMKINHNRPWREQRKTRELKFGPTWSRVRAVWAAMNGVSF
jgi:hypothetical protein